MGIKFCNSSVLNFIIFLKNVLTLYLPDQICNSLYCQPYNYYNVSSENLVSTYHPQFDIFLCSHHSSG